MEIYNIKLDYRYAIGDIISNKTPDTIGMNLTENFLKGFLTFGWITKESPIIPDITIIASELFSLDRKARISLESLLSGQNLKGITIGDTSYVVTMDIPILQGVLNMKSSKITRFSTGDIMEVKEPVFLPKEFPPLFRTEYTDNAIFCNGTFKEEVQKNRLTGLIFNACKIQSSSWLHKLLK